MTRGACYAFIIILAAISIMNLINTMINSVHVRKKELGMMQAIGISDRQLMKMLQLEGIILYSGHSYYQYRVEVLQDIRCFYMQSVQECLISAHTIIR